MHDRIWLLCGLLLIVVPSAEAAPPTANKDRFLAPYSQLASSQNLLAGRKKGARRKARRRKKTRGRRMGPRRSRGVDGHLVPGTWSTRAGVVFSNFVFDAGKTTSRAGLVAGVHYDKAVDRSVGWRTGLLYQQAGSNAPKGETSRVTRLHYLQIPYALTFRAESFRYIKPYLVGGIHVAYLLGASLDTPALGESESAFEDGLNRLDYGLDVGAGFIMTVRTTVLFSLELLFAIEVSEVQENRDAPALSNNNLSLVGALHF